MKFHISWIDIQKDYFHDIMVWKYQEYQGRRCAAKHWTITAHVLLNSSTNIDQADTYDFLSIITMMIDDCAKIDSVIGSYIYKSMAMALMIIAEVVIKIEGYIRELNLIKCTAAICHSQMQFP